MTFDEELQQLLLSSLTKSIILDFRRAQALQVGSKPRDGPFGASHYRSFEAQAKEILLARPGKRIWTADTESARVKQTINYQPSFENTQPTRLFATTESPAAAENVASVNFCQLVPFCEVVLSLSEKIIVLMDAVTNKILQWHCDAAQIVDVSIHEETQSAYVIVGDAAGSQRVSHLRFSVLHFVRSMLADKQHARAVHVLKKYAVSDLSILSSVLSQLPEGPAKAALSELISSFSEQRASVPVDAPVAAPSAVAPSLPVPVVPEVQPPAVDIKQNTDLSASIFVQADPDVVAAVSDPAPVARQAPSLGDSVSSSMPETPVSSSPVIAGVSDRDPGASSADGDSEFAPSLSDSQSSSPSLSGSFLKAEDAPSPVSASPMAAPIAKRVAGGAKKKKPRLAQIAPAAPAELRAPSPIMLEIQQRSTTPAPAPPSAAAAPAPAVPATSPVGTTEDLNGINAARLPMVIQSALNNGAPAKTDSTASTVSPSSSPSAVAPIQNQTPPLSHSASSPLSTSPGAAVAITADKALGEIKSMAKKIIDLPSMFTRTSSAPVGTTAPIRSSSETSLSASTSRIGAPDELSSTAATNLHEFRSKFISATAVEPLALQWERRLAFDDQIRPELQKWFDTYCSALSSESGSGKYPSAPDLVLKELITACFEFQVEATELPASRLRLWTDKEAQAFVKRYARFMSLPEALALSSERGWAGSFSMLLQYDEAVYQAREKHILNPRYRNWELLEELLSDGRPLDPSKQTALSKLTSKLAGDLSMLMKFLPRLFDVLPTQAVQLAVSSFPTLSPSNFERIVPSEHRPLLLEYFGRLMKKQSTCRASPELVLRWIRLLVSVAAPERESLFSGSAPKRGSLGVPWSNALELDQILSDSTSSEFKLPAVADLVPVFEESGYWRGLFVALRKSNRLVDALKLSIQLDDLESFKETLLNEDADGEVFGSGLLLLLESSQDSAIGFVQFFDCVLLAGGPHYTLTLLNSQPAESKTRILAALRPNFFRAVIRDAKHVRSQKDAARDILEAADSYLWSLRSPMMASQFRALEQAEAQEHKLHDNSLACLPYISSERMFDGRVEYSLNVAHRTPLVRVLGTQATHWGVRTKLRNQECPHCEIQLMETVSFVPGTSSSRIVVFEPCGHTYHEGCVEGDECFICAYNNRPAARAPGL